MHQQIYPSRETYIPFEVAQAGRVPGAVESVKSFTSLQSGGSCEIPASMDRQADA